MIYNVNIKISFVSLVVQLVLGVCVFESSHRGHAWKLESLFTRSPMSHERLLKLQSYFFAVQGSFFILVTR